MDDQRQVGGDHYKQHGPMQPFFIIDHYKLRYYLATTIKYILRYATLHNIQDLHKARHFLECAIERNEKAGE